MNNIIQLEEDEDLSGEMHVEEEDNELDASWDVELGRLDPFEKAEDLGT